MKPTSRLTSTLAALALAGAVSAFAPGAHAQQGSSPRQFLEDFTHYVTVGNFELAQANARALLDSGIDGREFLGLIEDSARMESRFEQAYRWAIRNESLEPVAAELYELYESGRRDRARNPVEVEANIELLGADARGRELARDRLTEAGEYAVPELYNALVFSDDAVIRAEVQRVLIDFGRDALEPLLAALENSTPSVQVALCEIMGAIGYARPLPQLYQLQANTSAPEVRAAARRAIERISGDFTPGLSGGGLFFASAENFYSESPSVTPFPGETHQLLWSWIDGVGLTPTAVRTEVYHEARAMALAAQAVELGDESGAALALWNAANFSREIDQPRGYNNPAYASSRRGAMYHALTAGAPRLQMVLARAIDTYDTELARLAIEALSRSAGGADLWTNLGNRRPLLEALSYPDRRVQYEAAVVLANADPSVSFVGAERVVPLLASAVRNADERFAVVVASEEIDQQLIREGLEDDGWTVLAPATSLDRASGAISRAPGVDLVVTKLNRSSTEEAVRQVRSSSRLGASPVLVLSSFGDRQALSPDLADRTTRFASAELTPSELAASAALLLDEAFGVSLNNAETARYALDAAKALQALAMNENEVLDVRDGTSPLIEALNLAEGETRNTIASTLSLIPRQGAQEALVEQAIISFGDDQVMLLEAAGVSARRFGNLLDSSLIPALRDIAVEGREDEALAAAALLGALNLPSGDLAPLIAADGN